MKYQFRPPRRAFTVNTLGALVLIGTFTLAWAKDDNNTPTALPEVVVTSRQDSNKGTYVAQDLSLTKFTQPLLDTAQSVDVVSRQLMDDQHVTTMRDAVRNVPGISMAAGEAGAQGDNLTLRGFSARNDIFLDGMRDFGSYYRDSFDYDKVEVLKGPSSITFGRGSTGGVVNQVSKTPENYREGSGELTWGSDNKLREAVDINEPLPKIEGAALRLNLVRETSDVSNRDIAENNHTGIAPSLVFGLSSPTRLTLSYLHEQEDDTPDYGVPWLNDAPAHVPRANYYGFKGDNYLKTIADIGTVKVEHDFSDDVLLRDQVRYGHYTRHFRITEPQLNSLPLTTVTRNELAGDSLETSAQNQLDLTTKFNTAFIEHTLVSGIEIGRETSQPTRYSAFTGVPTTDLFYPNYDQPFTGTPGTITRTYVNGDTLAFYTLDTMKLNEHWEIEGGVRWDQFDTDYKQTVAQAVTPTPSTAFSRVDKMTSWRGALVYKPVENGSIYFDYGTSFNPSSEALSLSAATAPTAPEKNETYEFGTKWDLFKKRLSLRSAIFETNKFNAREADPNPANSGLNVLTGAQRVEGLEFEVAGHLTKAWQITTGYAYMKSRLNKSNTFPMAVGSPLANVPANTFNFWSTYDLPAKLSKFQIGGGGDFVDARTASSTVPFAADGLRKELPSYWVFNAMVGYHVNKNVDVQVNIYNLADKYYYDQIHPSHVIPGEGRTVTVSTKFKF